MKRATRELLGLALVACLAGLSGLACSSDEAEGGREGRGGHAEAGGESELERGPHEGRLLEAGEFALELTIFEEGVPPEFRAYIYLDGEPRDPAG